MGEPSFTQQQAASQQQQAEFQQQRPAGMQSISDTMGRRSWHQLVGCHYIQLNKKWRIHVLQLHCYESSNTFKIITLYADVQSTQSFN